MRFHNRIDKPANKNMLPSVTVRTRTYVVFGAIIFSWILTTWAGLLIVDAMYHGRIAGGVFDYFMQSKDTQQLSQYRAALWQLTFLAHLVAALWITVAFVWRFRSAWRVGIVFIIGDLIIIAGSAIFGGAFRIWREPSIPEAWQNSKELFIAGVFFWLWRNRQYSLIFAAFAILFGWLFIDDAFKYHEWAGSLLASNFDFSAFLLYEGLREQDIGEILSLFIPMIFIFPLIAFAYLKSNLERRRTAHVIFSLIAALGFFGVFVDMLDRYAGLGSVSRLVVHLEDGGEMLVISMIAAYAFSLLWRPDGASE